MKKYHDRADRLLFPPGFDDPAVTDGTNSLYLQESFRPLIDYVEDVTSESPNKS